MHLKYSKGSRQSLHLNDALHAVDPNSLTTLVFTDSHRGHAILRPPCNNSRLLAPCSGGAMPYSLSFSLPSLLIQSVVQGGDNTLLIETPSIPCLCSSSITLCSITSVAGHPEYVGVNSTVTSSLMLTPRMMPRSAMLNTGISGSATSPSQSNTCLRLIPGVTNLHPGELVAGTASRRRCDQDVRCAGLPCHQ